MTSDSIKDWIDSFQDRNGRARAMLGSCAIDENDPDMVRLAAHAATGDSYHSQVTAALLQPAKKRRGRNKAERRLDRMHNHHPALAGLGWKPVKEGPVEKQYGGSPGPQARLNPQPEKPTSEAELTFDPSFATYVYENHKKMWPHLPDLKFDPPPGYKPRRPMVNPFRSNAPTAASFGPMRESWLTKREVRKVYNAMSYAMFKDGIIMNTHLIIIWSMMGLSPREANAVMDEYLNGARKWLRVGMRPTKRRSENPRTGVELRYVWVHENAPERGFHSHILIYLPRSLKEKFETWSRAYLKTLIGKHFPWKAFRLKWGYEKVENAQVARAWSWFRYLTKELHPQSMFFWINEKDEHRERLLREIVKPWPYRTNMPVPNMKLTGVSRNIDRGRQEQDGFVSKLSSCDFDQMYDGSELRDWCQRLEDEDRARSRQGLQV